MATQISKFRLTADDLAAVDGLAASNGGVRTTAVREAVHHWRAAVEAAARENAAAFADAARVGLDARACWWLLARSSDTSFLSLCLTAETPWPDDWSYQIGRRLTAYADWIDLSPVEPNGGATSVAARKLAEWVGGWGPVRGYALMGALRWWRRVRGEQPEEMADPKNWMTPAAKTEQPGPGEDG